MKPKPFKAASCAIWLALASISSAIPSLGLAQEPEAVVRAHAAPPPAPHGANLTPAQRKKQARGHAHQFKAATVAAAVSMSADPTQVPATEGMKPQGAAAAAEEALTATPSTSSAAKPAIPQEVVQFCTNNVAAAGQARVAWEAAKLKDLETKLRERTAELEAKRAEYEDWLRKREEALKKVVENVVAIYTKMRPEAAAQQLAALDDDMAAAVLMKLKPGNASAILNEMDPGRAARLTAAMVGANPTADGKKT